MNIRLVIKTLGLNKYVPERERYGELIDRPIEVSYQGRLIRRGVIVISGSAYTPWFLRMPRGCYGSRPELACGPLSRSLLGEVRAGFHRSRELICQIRNDYALLAYPAGPSNKEQSVLCPLIGCRV